MSNDFEVDFLPIEKTGSAGSRSGDAITMRFTDPTGVNRVVVIDGGYKETGERLVQHIGDYYDTGYVDLVISTHPDADHLNGLATVLSEMSVGELLIHRPHDHHKDWADYSNIEVVDAVIAVAEENGVTVTEPFTGLSRFAGAVRILGPTQDYYESLLAEHFAKKVEEKSMLVASAARVRESSIFSKAVDLLDRVLTYLPIETLSEGGETGERNSSSAITLVTVGTERMLFTGDAGIESMEFACTEYERIVGEFSTVPLRFFQAPHHGSHRNLAPSLLDRMFGKAGDTFGTSTAFVSSAKADPKHPSPKVTNALQRRDLSVFATEGQTLAHLADALSRPGWGPAIQIPPLDEDDD